MTFWDAADGWQEGCRRELKRGLAEACHRRQNHPFGNLQRLLSQKHSVPLRLRIIMAPAAARSRSSSVEFSPLAIGEDLTPLPEYKAAGSTDLDFSGYLSPPLRLHEDLKSGCGGQLWPAGMVLATHMLRHHRTSLKDAKMFVRPHFQ